MTPSPGLGADTISLVALTKRYPGGISAIKDVTLDVPAGSIFGFLGRNGAGKTTAIRIIAGLAHPTSGTVRVGDVPLGAGVDYRRRIGYLAQEPRFHGWMTGRQVLRYVAGFYPRAATSERQISNLIDRLGLGSVADRRVETYSGGTLQRLGIAQSLVGRPSVLVLDEPASSLDPIGRSEILELMRDLRGTTTVFYSTHILDDVERVADHVAILDRGRVVASAPTGQLLAGFTRGALTVAVAPGSAAFGERLRRVPGVVTVVPSAGEDPASASDRFTVRTDEDRREAVQAAATRLAAECGLALVENRPLVLDLETVFLQLVTDGAPAA